jgi:hypothetical protein
MPWIKLKSLDMRYYQNRKIRRDNASQRDTNVKSSMGNYFDLYAKGSQMKVSQCDSVENADLYAEVISTRVKAFIPLSHKPVDGVLADRRQLA